jgi:Holliday junction resolvase RusA-like endonuclease
MTIRLETLPLSTNNLYAHTASRRFTTSKGRSNKSDMAWEAMTQYRGKPLNGPVRVSVALYWPDRRKHDIDNLKGLFDALTGILWEDDDQIVDLHVRKSVDKKDPHVDLEFFPA